MSKQVATVQSVRRLPILQSNRAVIKHQMSRSKQDSPSVQSSYQSSHSDIPRPSIIICRKSIQGTTVTDSPGLKQIFRHGADLQRYVSYSTQIGDRIGLTTLHSPHHSQHYLDLLSFHRRGVRLYRVFRACLYRPCHSGHLLQKIVHLGHLHGESVPSI